MTDRSRRGRRAIVGLVLAAALAGCGSSRGSAGSSRASAGSTGSTANASGTTATSAAPSGTVPPGLDGSEAGQLPSAPAPTTAPALPSPATATGRRQFLGQVFTDTQQMWATLFASAGTSYSPARLVFFTSNVTTGCGGATSEIGPFYCPADRTVYLDTRFFDLMAQRYGVKGDFSEAFVVAHEMGHHVQNVLGVTGRVAAADQANPSQRNAVSIRVELQADCLAGVWAHSTYTRNLLEPGDLQEALVAAAAVGDDFQQKAATGQVTPDEWTHGTSAQRQRWLTAGFDSGQPSACDTFSSSS